MDEFTKLVQIILKLCKFCHNLATIENNGHTCKVTIKDDFHLVIQKPKELQVYLRCSGAYHLVTFILVTNILSCIFQ